MFFIFILLRLKIIFGVKWVHNRFLTSKVEITVAGCKTCRKWGGSRNSYSSSSAPGAPSHRWTIQNVTLNMGKIINYVFISFFELLKPSSCSDAADPAATSLFCIQSGYNSNLFPCRCSFAPVICVLESVFIGFNEEDCSHISDSAFLFFFTDPFYLL